MDSKTQHPSTLKSFSPTNRTLSTQPSDAAPATMTVDMAASSGLFDFDELDELDKLQEARICAPTVLASSSSCRQASFLVQKPYTVCFWRPTFILAPMRTVCRVSGEALWEEGTSLKAPAAPAKDPDPNAREGHSC